MTEPRKQTCDTFWGSHGCELPEGHDPEQEHPVHQCSVPLWDEDGETGEDGVCSQAQYVDAENIRTRFTKQAGMWTKWDVWALPLFRLNDEEAAR